MNKTALLTTVAVTAALFVLQPTASAQAASTLPITAVTASSDDGNGPGNAIDGNLATRWSGAGDGVWIRFDLGSVAAVGSVSLAWYDGNKRRSTFDVQLSQNGSTWSTVLSRQTGSGATLALETYSFIGSQARYVRVVGHGNSSSDSSKWTSIAEATVSGDGPTGPPSSGQTTGVGGVTTPAGATIVGNQSSEYTISSGGSLSSPKVYDCKGNTIHGGVVVHADNVVIQNCRVDADQRYGIYSDNHDNVTIQNNDIKNIHGPGDLNAITFFGNKTKIQYNTAIDFVTGDPGDSHTDFIQTWVSSSHPTSSDEVEIRSNRAIGPANPGRDNSVPSIHQFFMAEDYGRGGNSGGDRGGMTNWIIADNEVGDSWNQAVKLDGPDNVSITRNKFVGSSDKVMDITNGSSGVKFYSDNQVGSGYGSAGTTVTVGSGPA